MSLTEKAQETSQEIADSKHINNVWELLAAILYRFGLGAGAAAALVALLTYGTSVLWADRAAINIELKQANGRLVEHLMESNLANASLARDMTKALTEANAIALQTSQSNEKLARAIDDLTNEFRRSTEARP